MNEDNKIKTDEVLIPVREFIAEMVDINGYLKSGEHGVESSITELTVETPVELEIVVDDEGKVHLGTAPPIYHLETTVMPVFHGIRIHALVNNNNTNDG